jgi:hypothetical protein
LARFTKEAISTTIKTAPIAIRTILAGGRFFVAVPYSSPMLIVGPTATAGGAGGFGGGAGVGSGIEVSRNADSTSDGRWGVIALAESDMDRDIPREYSPSSFAVTA